MPFRRRHKWLTLVWIISVAVLLAESAAAATAIAMLPCGAAKMGANAPNAGAVAPVLCKAACTSQDNLLDGSAGFDNPPAAPLHYWPVIAGLGKDVVVARQYSLLHAQGPPLHVLLCRFLD